jgi:hypothetical protein
MKKFSHLKEIMGCESHTAGNNMDFGTPHSSPKRTNQGQEDHWKSPHGRAMEEEVTATDVATTGVENATDKTSESTAPSVTNDETAPVEYGATLASLANDNLAFSIGKGPANADDDFKLVKPPKGKKKAKAFGGGLFPNPNGIRFNRSGNKGTTALHPADIKELFAIIESIDPKAEIRNHANDAKTTRPIKELTTNQRNDFNAYLDVHTFAWGKPTDNKEKTMFSFYVLSEEISSNLEELRNNTRMKKYQQSGNCQIQPHDLEETRSTVLGYFQGKDVNHTHRDELTERFYNHLNPPLQRDIPIKIIKQDVVTKEGLKVKMCAVLIGKSQLDRVTKYLGDKPFPDVNFIFHRTRNTDPETYSKLIQQHVMLVTNSRAIKLENVSIDQWNKMNGAKLTDQQMKTKIIDVTMGHAAGVAYVQYLADFREQVTNWVTQQITQFQTGAGFTNPPQIVPSRNGRDSMSAVTKQTTSTATQVQHPMATDFSNYCQGLDSSKAKDMVQSASSNPHRPPQLSRTDNRVKSFVEVLTGRPTSPLSSLGGTDDRSDATPSRSNCSKDRSRSSLASQKLIQENQILAEQLAEQKQHNAAQQQEMTELKSMIQELRNQMASLSHTTGNQRADAHNSHDEGNPKKRPNNKRTPVKAPPRATMPRNAPGTSSGNTDQGTYEEDMDIQPQQLSLEEPAISNGLQAMSVSDTINKNENSEPQTPSQSKAAGDDQNE